MEKPKLLYASPFWPIKSGISNYSSRLIQALRNEFEITLLVDGYRVKDPKLKGLPVIQYKKGARYNGYDAILYNIGNQPDYHGYMLEAMRENPGYVILHDVSLYYLVVGTAMKEKRVLGAIYKEAGIDGIQLLKADLKQDKNPDLLQHKRLASILTMNKSILSMAKGIFVHSKYAESCLREQGIAADIWKMEHLTTFGPERIEGIDRQKAARWLMERWEIPEDAFLIVAAGFIAPTKQNRLTCRAVKRYNRIHTDKVYYLMLGEGNDADGELDDYCKKTGFAPDDEFQMVIARADIVFNLRYPTNGETSGTLIQAMQMGKPCVTTAVGWFDELPDKAVIKVRQDVTEAELVKILENKNEDKLKELGTQAKRYVEIECDPQKIAQYIRKKLPIS